MVPGRAWEDLVPPSVVRVLRECDGVARLRDLMEKDGVVEGFDPSV
jgi:hypothetical protein